MISLLSHTFTFPTPFKFNLRQWWMSTFDIVKRFCGLDSVEKLFIDSMYRFFFFTTVFSYQDAVNFVTSSNASNNTNLCGMDWMSLSFSGILWRQFSKEFFYYGIRTNLNSPVERNRKFWYEDDINQLDLEFIFVMSRRYFVIFDRKTERFGKWWAIFNQHVLHIFVRGAHKNPLSYGGRKKNHIRYK